MCVRTEPQQEPNLVFEVAVSDLGLIMSKDLCAELQGTINAIYRQSSVELACNYTNDENKKSEGRCPLQEITKITGFD